LTTPLTASARPAVSGTPIAGVEIRLVDDACNDAAPDHGGEIAVRGHTVTKGYRGRPNTPREPWLADELLKGPTGKILEREIAVPTHTAN
jgi:long-subunit acyl-CoA synthetase (AMP-forming)